MGAANMVSTKSVFCKYYMHGCCMYGDNCAFSHNRSDSQNMVCTYYLAGCCAYGDKCRYDHVRPDWNSGHANNANNRFQPPVVVPKPVFDQAADVQLVPALEPGQAAWAASTVPPMDGGHGAWGGPPLPVYDTGYDGGYDQGFDPVYGAGYVDPPGAYAPDSNSFYGGAVQDGYDASLAQQQLYGGPEGEELYYIGEYEPAAQEPYSGEYARGEWADDEWYDEAECEAAAPGSMQDPAEVPLCSQWRHHGSCARGDHCELIHGHYCETCGQFCLHPYNPQQQSEHLEECGARAERAAARARSAQVECGICMEPVLSKPTASERKFGLLACEHAFCLSCIRSWRNNQEVDTETAARTCPICRVTTHFVTPSGMWPASGEEKEAIRARYKERLSAIDCRHFSFGNGTCPFGTSCFYRHAYKDGTLEDPNPVLRKCGTADGDIKVLQPLKLANFLETPHAQRLLRGRRR